MNVDSKLSAENSIQAFSIKDFSKVFKIGRSKIFDEISKKRLKARKVGSRTLIAYEDAISWFKSLPVR